MSGGEEKLNGESAPPAVQVVSVNSELKYIAPVPEPIDTPIAIGPDTVFTGELLRQIRESRNLSLRDIADRTRISFASLSALESERFEDLPNARVYVRGFIRCLATEIGLDKDHVSRTYLPRWQAWYEAQHGR